MTIDLSDQASISHHKAIDAAGHHLGLINHRISFLGDKITRLPRAGNARVKARAELTRLLALQAAIQAGINGNHVRLSLKPNNQRERRALELIDQLHQ